MEKLITKSFKRLLDKGIHRGFITYEELEKSLGKVMLIPSLFMHFYLEHNFGHHLNVATKEDPVTAKYNEPLYLYWITTPIKEIISAIKIQKNLLNRTKSSFFSIKNDLLFYIIIQSLYLFLITYFFG